MSEVRLSDLEFSGRIDSEYYKKEFLLFEDRVTSLNHEFLHGIVSFLVGPFGSAFDTANYESDSGYRYIRGQDVKPFLLQDTEGRYMPSSDFQRLSKYALQANDIFTSVPLTI